MFYIFQSFILLSSTIPEECLAWESATYIKRWEMQSSQRPVPRFSPKVWLWRLSVFIAKQSRIGSWVAWSPVEDISRRDVLTYLLVVSVWRLCAFQSRFEGSDGWSTLFNNVSCPIYMAVLRIWGTMNPLLTASMRSWRADTLLKLFNISTGYLGAFFSLFPAVSTVEKSPIPPAMYASAIALSSSNSRILGIRIARLVKQ